MKLFSTPYYCPKCKEKLNLQWDFDPAKEYFKCVECGTWLEHEDEKAEYKIYKGKNPGDSPVKEASFDSGDMDDDFFDSPSSPESGEHGKVVTDIAPFAKDEIQKEDEARADEAIAKYKAVLDPKEEAFEAVDFGAVEVAEGNISPEEKAPDQTRKKGWTWPWGKKKAEDAEEHFQEDEIPEEVEVNWEEEISEEKKDDTEKKAVTEKKSSAPVRFFKHMFRHRKAYLIGLVIIAALGVGYTIYHHLSKMVPVGFSDEQAGTMNYEEVTKLLEKAGYTNIEAVPLEDLQSRNMDQENQVDMISIGGDMDFTEKDRFEYDSEVLIQYHSAKMIKMPLDPKKVNEKTVKELENLLQKAGFEKISVEPDYDLIFGILHKEGDVEKITVNGSTKFSELQAYRIDTEIVITYHDFKKNDTKK